MSRSGVSAHVTSPADRGSAASRLALVVGLVPAHVEGIPTWYRGPGLDGYERYRTWTAGEEGLRYRFVAEVFEDFRKKMKVEEVYYVT